MGLPEEIREAHSRSGFLLPSVRADQIPIHLHSRAEVGHLIKINKRLVFYYLIRSMICLWFASDLRSRPVGKLLYLVSILARERMSAEILMKTEYCPSHLALHSILKQSSIFAYRMLVQTL